MTSQGRHRAQPHTGVVPFAPTKVDATVMRAAALLEEKGYEVRQVRITWTGHGGKAAVVLHVSPAPVKAWQVGGRKRTYSKYPQYHDQNVGATARRNIDTLLAYVEGLPNVECAVHEGTRVDSAGRGEGVHDDTTECAGSRGA